MAEVIYLREIQAARRRGRIAYHESLKRAVELLKLNLADAAQRLISAPPEAQSELLGRVEKLAALIRYSRRMLSEDDERQVSVGE